MRKTAIVMGATALIASAGLAQADEFSNAAEFNSVITNAQVSNFEGFAHRELVDADALGVSFNNSAIAWDIEVSSSGGTFESPQNVLRNRNANAVRFDLAEARDAVGIFNTSLADVLELRLYDVNDNLVAAIELGMGEVTFGGYAAEGSQIKWGEIVTLEGNGYYFIDSLVAGDTTIPAPSSLAAAGLLGLAAARRRR